MHALAAAIVCISSLAHARILTPMDKGCPPPTPTACKATASLPTATGTPVAMASMTGPLLTEILGNPSIFEFKGMYYAYASHSDTDGNFQNVPMAMSPVLDSTTQWKMIGDALPSNVGAWTVQPGGGKDAGVWTPDVSQLDDGSLIMYYSAHAAHPPNGGDERCLGVATAAHPTGPWTPQKTALYCPGHDGAIGADGIKDGNRRYVLFKDGSHVASGSSFGLLQVDPADGSTLLHAKPVDITTESACLPGWEGPALAQTPHGNWLLLHTTGVDTCNYTVHYATAQKITSTFHEGGVLLPQEGHTDDGAPFYLPGGPDFVGASNTEFTFFAVSERGRNDRHMYYGKLKYTFSGGVEMSVTRRKDD